MAKNKSEETKVDETVHHDVSTPDPQLMELQGKVQKYESLLVEVLPALHRFRRQLPNSVIAQDANLLYQKVRDSLGEVGQQIDADLRK